MLTNGAASHFAPDPERSTAADDGVIYREDGAQTSVPEDFYSTRFYTDKLISYLERTRGDGRPFLALATYTAPHWPLQVPEDYIDRYKGVYDEGYDAAQHRIEDEHRKVVIIASRWGVPRQLEIRRRSRPLRRT